MAEKNGQLIEFLADDRIRFALVEETNAKKIHIVDQNGKQHNIAPAQVVCRFDKSGSRSTFAELIESTQPAILSLAAEVDLGLLWEAVHSESSSEEHTLENLADTYFNQREPLFQSAVFHAVFDDHMYFKRKGTKISSRSAAQIEEIRVQADRARQQEALQARIESWLERVFVSESLEAGPDDEALLQEAEAILFEHRKNTLFSELEKDNESSPRELAFEILQRFQRLPEDADPLLLISGIRKAFPERLIKAADAVEPYSLDAAREHLDAPVFSIDDPETEEVDDAVSVEKLPDGLRVGIHITEVANFVLPGDALDREAGRRLTSVYLPTDTVTMLPEKVSCDLASLSKGCLRPALSLFIECGMRGEMRSWHFAQTSITVTERLDYEGVDKLLLERDPGDISAPVVEALRLLKTVCDSWFNSRLEKDAIVINRPEFKIRVTNNVIKIKKFPVYSPSRRIIQELMILYNSLAGKYTSENKLPALYRTQSRPADSSFPAGIIIEYEPHKMAGLFRQLKPAKLSVEPSPHAAIGADAYTQASSPLRRYTDLVMQRQIISGLHKSGPVYKNEKLWEILAQISGSERDLIAIERKSNRFWSLEYLSQNYPDTVLEGIVTEKKKGGIMVELDVLPTRGFLPGHSNTEPGTRIKVRINRIDPRKDILYFAVSQ